MSKVRRAVAVRVVLQQRQVTAIGQPQAVQEVQEVQETQQQAHKELIQQQHYRLVVVEEVEAVTTLQAAQVVRSSQTTSKLVAHSGRQVVTTVRRVPQPIQVYFMEESEVEAVDHAQAQAQALQAVQAVVRAAVAVAVLARTVTQVPEVQVQTAW